MVHSIKIEHDFKKHVIILDIPEIFPYENGTKMHVHHVPIEIQVPVRLTYIREV